MKKNIFKYLLLTLAILALCFALASCSVLEGLLPGNEKDPCTEHVDADTDGKCDECGETVSPIDPEGNPEDEPIKDMGAAPNVKGVSFKNKTVIYNGQYHELSVDKSTLPSGVVVLYSTNKYMNVGVYEVTADFYWGGAKIEGASKTATLTINKATYDVSTVSLLGVTKYYDGEEVVPKIGGKVPSGVTVDYTYKNSKGETVESMVNADTYTVWATFAGDVNNYHEIAPISATVQIRRARISGISFADARFDYDGTAKSIFIEYIGGELPAEVSVSYIGNEQIDNGTYTVTAKFTVSDNYEPIDDISAVLKITNKIHDMSGISLRGETATYDGLDHMPAIIGELPAGVSVVITATDANGETLDAIVNAGEYTVTAKFTVTAEYEPIADMTAKVVITKASVSGISFADDRQVYDGSPKYIYATGVPEGITVEYVGNGQIDFGVYTVTAKFTSNGNYVDIPDMQAVLTISAKFHDMTGVELLGETVTYDGENHMPVINGNIPEGVTVTMIATDANGNAVTELINAGVYTVTAKFGVEAGYEAIPDMTVTVTINKAVFENVVFEDLHAYYDGTVKYIYVQGIPSAIEIEYVGNGQTYPGVYTVTATVKANDNYVAPAPMTATLTIELGDPKEHPTSQITYEKVSGGYAVTGISEDIKFVIIPATYQGENVVSIKSNAFRGAGLEYVYIPETVANIGNAAFYGCSALRTVKIADFSVTVGADGNLVTVASSALTTIGQKAFADTAITEIDLPDSVTAIGFGAFDGCNAMTKITVPFIGGSRATTHSFLAYIFGSAAAETGYNYVPATLKSVIISDNCTEIPAFAFYKLSGIESIYVGKSVTKIGNSAFAYTGISDIFLPASVSTIPAAVSAENSPFYGCSDSMLVAFESAASTLGTHYASISENKQAFVVFNKTYEDYVMNKESYKVADPTDASLVGIYYDGVLISGFSTDTLNYTIDVDVNQGVGVITALKLSAVAEMEIVKNKDGVTITVTSYDGLTVKAYNVRYNVTGEFTSTSAVVNKNGASGTVSFVIDDGYEAAGNFAKQMLAKYPNLALNFAIPTRKFATLQTEDKNGDGIPEYKKDENGNYVYEVETATVDYWKDILTSALGRTEIIAHSHDHGFWGINDKGGLQITMNDKTFVGTQSVAPEGGSTANIWASQQIVSDIFGEYGCRAVTFITPGIVRISSNKELSKDYKVTFNNSAVWLVSDTAVNTVDGSLAFAQDTVISLQSIDIVLPAGTKITTVADHSSGVIAAGSVVRIVSGNYTIPAGTMVLGYGAYWKTLYDAAYDAGLMIAARNTGASGTSTKGYYTKDYFTTVDNRQLQRSFGISVSDSTTEATVDGWVSHIDNAVAKGVWVSYCIHNILTPETATGNYILEEHAERLFSQAASYGDDIWIANYTDATLYYHEWSSAVVTSSYNASASEITVSLTDGERDDIYNMALTIKVAIPGNWATATVNGQELAIRSNADGSAFVYVDVVPETSVVIAGR